MVGGFMQSIDQIIQESITYDPSTGKLFWRSSRPSYHFKTKSTERRWYTLFAGNEISGQCEYGSVTYINVRINGTKHKAHRVAWFLHYGVWPEGDIDHWDGDGLNNRIANLRDVPRQINSHNASISKNNNSGVNGVNFRKDNGKWVARGNTVIEGEFVREYLGQFDSLEDAKKARKDWEDSQGNFTERHGK
jgi:hypothetical protein